MRFAVLLIWLALGACARQSTTASGQFIGPTWPAPRITGEPTSQQIAELQLFVIPFNRKVRELPGFSDLYIEHEPRWHVVVAFTKSPPLSRVKSLAPPVIRDRIAVRSAKRTQAQITADLDALAAALRETGIDFGGGYDPRRQRFEIKVGKPEHVGLVTAAVPPDLRADIDVTVGPLPVPE